MTAYFWTTSFTAKEVDFYKAGCYIKQPRIVPGESETLFDDLAHPPQ